MERKFHIVWGLIVGSALLFSCQGPAPAEWTSPPQPSLGGGGLVCLSPHPSDQGKFLVANRSQLFEGPGTGEWKTLWSDHDPSARIEKILTFPWVPNQIFVITGEKIFMGSVGSERWSPVYERGSQGKKTPLSFTVMPDDPNRWFVGTLGGLQMSSDAGKTWSRADIFHGSSPVSVLFARKNKLFIGTENSLLLSLEGAAAREVIALTKKEIATDPTVSAERTELEDGAFYVQKIRAMVPDETDPTRFFLGTLTGAYESRDGGYRWRPLSRSGMQSAEVLDLAYDPRTRSLFAATPDGIYQYQTRSDSWRSLCEGIARPYSKSIAVANGDKLAAITDEGFVECPIKPEIHIPAPAFDPPSTTVSLFRKLVSLEPTAREVQKKIIQYADVGNGKIKRWHAASRIAGLLPSFSFGKDFSTSSSIDLDRGGTNDADRYILGPEDRSKGWDADVSWDLGDVIYSSDQTSIDSREKLMVELRQDLVSEAMRIYFERRRFQVDIVYTPSLTEQEHLERLIRLDELTALLDGMMDGFFSKRLEQIYERNEELSKLWIYQPKQSG